MPVIPPHGRWRQGDQEYKVILGYIVSWGQPGLHESLLKEECQSWGGVREEKGKVW